MSSRFVAALGLASLLTVAACSGDASSPSAAPTSAPSVAASEAAPSVAASEAPPSEAPSGTSGCTPTTDTAVVVAGMEGIAFLPATVEARVGEVIAWTNSDSASHTATLTDDPSCTTDVLSRGGTGALVFSQPGSYPFFCRIHPTSMTGTIEISE